jgi:hypothetical protein
MIVYVLFVHKKSVSKRKVCIIFITNSKFNPKKNIFSGFLGGFFGVFLGGFFIANPVPVRVGGGGGGEADAGDV